MVRFQASHSVLIRRPFSWVYGIELMVASFTIAAVGTTRTSTLYFDVDVEEGLVQFHFGAELGSIKGEGVSLTYSAVQSFVGS